MFGSSRTARTTSLLSAAAALSALAAAVPASTASAATRVRECRTADLRAGVRETPGSAGAGNRYGMLRLTNSSGSSCVVRGFGGVELRDGRGTAVAVQTRDRVHRGRRVLLRSGRSAVARLHWTVVPSGDQSDASCRRGRVLVVTPPDETQPIVLQWRLGAVCGRQVDQRSYVAA